MDVGAERGLKEGIFPPAGGPSGRRVELALTANMSPATLVLPKPDSFSSCSDHKENHSRFLGVFRSLPTFFPVFWTWEGARLVAALAGQRSRDHAKLTNFIYEPADSQDQSWAFKNF